MSVIHDISARILSNFLIVYGLQGKLVDVETAFLYGDLKEEVYMDCPEGMANIKEDETLLLQSTIYGLVQTARQYVLQESDQYSQRSGRHRRCIRFLFVLPRHRKRKSLLWTLCRWQFANRRPTSHLRSCPSPEEKGLVLKIDYNLNDCLSCGIRISDNKNRSWIGQPNLIANLQDKFWDKWAKCWITSLQELQALVWFATHFKRCQCCKKTINYIIQA